jgi:hypothetical protein
MSGIYAFEPGPRYRGATEAELWQSAADQPLSMLSTIGTGFVSGTLESFGLGTAIRGLAIPEGEPTTGGTLSSALRLINPLTTAYETTRLAVQSGREDSPAMSEDEWKSSAFFRANIPYDAGMTRARAEALASWDDARKVREHFSAKRPISSFIGNLTGQALDPINYVPVAGPAVKAAAIARAGRIAGTAAVGAVDAAANTAMFGLATRDQRAAYGDDVSWQTTISEIAVAALIGSAFGGIAGAWEGRTAARASARAQTQLATLKATQEARIALNEAIDGVVRGEDLRLSPNAAEPIASQMQKVRGSEPVSLSPETFYRQPHGTIDDLYTVAGGRQKSLDEAARLIGDEIGVEYKSPGIKDRATAEAKIARKGYDGPARLTDVVRGGFVVDTVEKSDQIIARLAQQFDVLDEGWVRNKDGYVDRKALVRFDDGTIGEIQLWEPKILAAKKSKGHALYKKARVLDFGSAEAKALRKEMQELYSAASAEAGPDWSRIGGESSPKLLNRSRQAASDMIPAVDQTSQASTLTQSELGLSMARASDSPSTAGRSSQFTKSIDKTSRRGVIDTTTARTDPPPDGLAEAGQRVANPEGMRELADQHSVDMATGDFPELAEVEQLRALGRLTPEDEAAWEAASQTIVDAEAYGNTLKAALRCLV